jgi:hypothetical protein
MQHRLLVVGDGKRWPTTPLKSTKQNHRTIRNSDCRRSFRFAME